jgi:hypothetical protein
MRLKAETPASAGAWFCLSLSILENGVELIGVSEMFIFGWGSGLICFRCGTEGPV